MFSSLLKSRDLRLERGAIAVEFALVVPVLVMLLVGTVTAGVSYSRGLGVTNAVREGARFGATANASSPSWGTDVIARVRDTQFDDPGGDTAICVQLVKAGTEVKSACAPSAFPIPNVTAYPAVPTSLPSTVCVVRVVAARDFSINTVLLPPFERTMTRGSVARYERDTCS